MEKDPNRKTLNLDQAAEEAGVSRRTIYNWIRAQKVETLRTAGGSLRVYADSLFQAARHPK